MSARTAPPPPGPPRAAALPLAVERTLSNGLRAVAFRQSNVPLVSAQLLLGAGGAAEGEAEAGLAAMTAALLTSGTTRRSAAELAQEIDGLGGRLDAQAGYDASIVGAGATTPAFPRALELLAEVVQHPAFAPDEVERVRARSISDLNLVYANPSSLARLVAARVAFGDGPYGHPLAGTAATLAALGRDRVAWFHERFYRPDNAVLVIGGDLETDEAFALAERVLGGWRAPATPLTALPSAAAHAGRPRVVIVDQPDAGRTAVYAGRVAIPRRSPDYAAATVATAVLSGYSGRLNQEVRVKRGLSYGAGASLVARRDAGTFSATTLVDHTRVPEAVEVIRATLHGIATSAPGVDELRPRKATVSGGFTRGIETIDGVAATLAEYALYGLPLDELQAWLPSIEAVTPDDVRRAGAAIATDPFLVLVGRADAFAGGIDAHGGDLRVIPFGALDLGATL